MVALKIGGGCYGPLLGRVRVVHVCCSCLHVRSKVNFEIVIRVDTCGQPSESAMLEGALSYQKESYVKGCGTWHDSFLPITRL